MKKATQYIFIACSCVLLFSGNAFCYDNEKSHRDLTDSAILDPKLDNVWERLGFNNKSRTKLIYKGAPLSINYIIQQGSFEEDEPDCRASFHFHDPTKRYWWESHLTDDINTLKGNLAVRVNCGNKGWDYQNRKSNITWATGFNEPPPEGLKATLYTQPEYPYNWDLARDYYFQAMTGTGLAGGQQAREEKFASTFETLGHIMHLLQDVSVPGHVRNDFTSHVVFNGIPDNLLDIYKAAKWFIQPFEHYIKTHPELIREAAEQPITPNFQNTRLTDFWDTTQYRENPDMPPAEDSVTSGLAETTNANYFSLSTIPTTETSENHKYAYPKLTTGTHHLCSEFIPQHVHSGQGPTNFHRKYISREPCPDIEQLGIPDKYVAVSVLNEEDIGDDSIDEIRTILDPNVYETYARELLPRAIGYSAALLDYFFRGNIKIGQNTNGNYVIENYGDERLDGVFTLYYDDADGVRRQVQWTGWEGLAVIDPVDAQGNPGQSFAVQFETPDTVGPENPDRYILVFHGWMGNEEGAVAAWVGDLTIWEPWGENVCQNNPWLLWVSLRNSLFDYTDIYGWCPDNDETINGTGYIGEAWSLADGVLSFEVPTSLYNSEVYSLRLMDQDIVADQLVFKINTYITGQDYPDDRSLIELKVTGTSHDKYFFLDGTDPPPVGPYLGDNNGEEQGIRLSDYGFDPGEHILDIAITAFCYKGDTCGYQLDYIDFISD